jgi:hypothetical protein
MSLEQGLVFKKKKGGANNISYKRTLPKWDYHYQYNDAPIQTFHVNAPLVLEYHIAQ